MSTSEELREALTRRLKKIDKAGGAEIQVPPAVGQNGGTESPQERADGSHTYRSGWNNTPPLARSNMLPPPPPVPPSPTRSEVRRASAEEIADGLVDQRRSEIIRSGSASPQISSSMRSVGRLVDSTTSSAIFVPSVEVTAASVILEGYLSKCSSGTLTSRWQKRYFVLRETELEYFGKESAFRSQSKGPSASVKFPIKKIKAVEVRTNREFDLLIGSSEKRLRRYQLKGSSPHQAKTWITALEAIISKFDHHRGSAAGGSADSIASSSEIGDASLGDDSSHTVTVTSESGAVDILSFPKTSVDPLFEHPEISSEEIDALFAEWFGFLDDPRSEIKGGRMIDAASRAATDLLAVLGSLPRGEDVAFSEAKSAIVKKKQSGEISLVPIGDYVVRICQKLLHWLARGSSVQRKSITDDIPVLIEWVSRFNAQLEELFPPVAATGAGGISSGSPEDDSDSSMISGVLEGGKNCDSIAWRKALKFVLNRLASEWEVLIIEAVQGRIPSESVWDAPASVRRVSSTNILGSQNFSKPIVLTSWTLDFITAINETILSRSTRGTLWSIAYPTCVDVLTGHCANALIACMNSCYREFKSRSNQLSNYKKSTKLGKAFSKMKTRLSTRRVSSGGGQETPPSPPRVTSQKNLNVSFEHMVAFGNECTILSVFCQHASGIAELRSHSSVFSACLESLSTAFANTSNEIARSIVKIHFTDENKKILASAFDPKTLAIRVKVPITETLDVAQEFISNDVSVTVGCHDLLRYLIVGQVMHAVSSGYVSSLVKHKPKILKFPRLGAVVAEDEGLFFSMFRDLGRPATEINTAIDPISHIRAILSERDDEPPSQGGIALVHHCVDIVKVFSSFQRAVEVIKALLDIKGLSKSDKKDVLHSVSVCVQRYIESPPPQMDAGDDDDDDSGSDPSAGVNKTTDYSF